MALTLANNRKYPYPQVAAAEASSMKGVEQAKKASEPHLAPSSDTAICHIHRHTRVPYPFYTRLTCASHTIWHIQLRNPICERSMGPLTLTLTLTLSPTLTVGTTLVATLGMTLVMTLLTTLAI